MVRALSLVLVLIVALLVGCGGSSDDGSDATQSSQDAEAEVRELDEVVRTSFIEGDYATFCASLTEDLQSVYASSAESCEKGSAQIAESMGATPSFPVLEEIRVNGDTGRVSYENGTIYAIERIDGEWHLGWMTGGTE